MMWVLAAADTNDTNRISQIARNNLRLSTGQLFRF
jgi:hypothetical protein